MAGVLIGLFSTGCAGGAFSAPDGGRPAPARRLAEQGVDALAAGNHARATQSFNHALKLDAENPTLHLLNGLSHHAAYRAGARGRGEMAETGYLVALKQDPGNWRAAYQLGVLYLDMRRYTAAQGRLAQAARGAEDDADVYYALATASYYTRDLGPALWAVRRALELAPDRPELVQAGAMIASAAGLGDDATRYLARYRTLEPDAARHTRVARRVSQWARTHELAQAQSGAPPSSQPGPSPAPLQSPGSGPSPMDPTAPGAVAGGPPPRMPVALSWSDCVQYLTPPAPQQSQQSSSYSPSYSPSSSSGYGGSTSADETTPLPALPSPCVGMPLPRMALIDVTIVRTEETRTTGQGVNLLESLSVVLGGNASRTQTDITSVTNRVPTTISTLTNVFASSFGLPAAGITYALDIANTADTRVEIIARPTLISLDRTPSNFFSGSNITIALAGQYGGTVQEKPVGVSLSVTPTFLDDDSMLLSVKATRSAFETGVRGSFDQALNTSRNAVNASVLLKFGQTLVLSGMVERDVQDSDSGVPGLRDLPVVQYFFGRRVTKDFEKEVVVILTPRRPTLLAEALGSVQDYLSRPDLDEEGRHHRDHIKAQARRALSADTPNVTAIIASLSNNLFIHEFRTGDLAPPRVHGGPDVKSFLKSLLELLYF